MRILFFGSRSLTWKHLRLMRLLARHASLVGPPPLDEWLEFAGAGSPLADVPSLPESEPLVLLHGDGPPGGSVPCAIGADRLAEFACMERWPERRRVRRFPVEQGDGESWGVAAARRNAAMVAAKPHRAYCVHTDLDSSKGSSMTAGFLKNAGIRFWYVRVSQAGALVSVEQR